LLIYRAVGLGTTLQCVVCVRSLAETDFHAVEHTRSAHDHCDNDDDDDDDDDDGTIIYRLGSALIGRL